MTSIGTDEAARLGQIRRALLEQRVRAAGMNPTASEPPAVSSLTVSGPMPLSASQSQMWYQSQLAPDSRVLNEVIEIRKTGALDVDALRRAVSDVVARHEALRTTFDLIDGVPHQIIREPTEVDVLISDLSDLDTEDAVARAVDIVTTDSLRPYDLANGPLIRPRLIRIAEYDHRLYIGLHHLIWDGLTLNRVVFPELVVLYRSYTTGVPSALRRPEAQYVDYTQWELDWLRGPETAKRIERWRNRLADITATQLPFDHPRPSRQTFAGGTIPLTIDDATVEGLRAAARAAAKAWNGWHLVPCLGRRLRMVAAPLQRVRRSRLRHPARPSPTQRPVLGRRLRGHYGGRALRGVGGGVLHLARQSDRSGGHRGAQRRGAVRDSGQWPGCRP
jgi:hypothetical protein